MNLTEVKSLLITHRDEIMAGDTKSDRLVRVIAFLEQAYPDVPLSAALNGPITAFVAKGNRIEVQPLIDTLCALNSYDTDALVFGNEASGDIETIVRYIQQFIAK